MDKLRALAISMQGKEASKGVGGGILGVDGRGGILWRGVGGILGRGACDECRASCIAKKWGSVAIASMHDFAHGIPRAEQNICRALLYEHGGEEEPIDIATAALIDIKAEAMAA